MIKINTRDYDGVFFTSDWHWAHDKVFLFEPRGCSTREEHMDLLTKGINNQATTDSLIIHLGDMALTCEYDYYRNWLLDGINCQNIWGIEGNHDNRWNRITSFSHTYDKNLVNLGFGCDMVFNSPSNVVGKKDSKHKITCCHYAMEIWNGSHHGSWHLSGHSHGSFEHTTVDYPYGKRLDIGVENALKYNGHLMFTLDDIVSIMSCKSINMVDHHNEKTT